MLCWLHSVSLIALKVSITKQVWSWVKRNLLHISGYTNGRMKNLHQKAPSLSACNAVPHLFHVCSWWSIMSSLFLPSHGGFNFQVIWEPFYKGQVLGCLLSILPYTLIHVGQERAALLWKSYSMYIYFTIDQLPCSVVQIWSKKALIGIHN